MSAYLAEHLPHLTSLRALLGLPAEAATHDEAKIEAAIKSAVTALVRERETEVENWREAIAGVRREVGLLARAVGEKGRRVVEENRRDSLELLPLPAQHERLTKQKEDLFKEYEERLRTVEKLQAQVDYLCTLLGPPFEPPKPLQPIAGPSKLPDPGLKAPNGTSGSRKVSGGPTLAQQIEEGKSETWLDVGEEVMESLGDVYQKALEERTIRLNNLQNLLLDLLWIHRELGLPPVPLSHPHHFPIHLLPSKSTEEQPGAHSGYEKLLSRFFTANAGLEYDDDEGAELAGMDGVEPEVGLVAWAEEVSELWVRERDARQARIQLVFNQLEPLWARLEVDQDQIDLFVQMNMGCSEASIKAYEVELERCLELRRSSLSAFVIGARKEIESLWEVLMLSDAERGEFGPFIDDEFTEELLHAHEEEAERLRAEIDSKATMLPKVREWHKLLEDEIELERSASDPNRFKARGAQLLKEEKLRKRVTMLKPTIEKDLLRLLPEWEEANGRPFMVQGDRVVDKILDDREAKEMAKEAKKRAKQGLAPTKMLPRPTPAGSFRSQPASTLRKREAPTPCPSNATANKRQRLQPASSIRVPSKSSISQSRPPPHYHGDQGSSPTPLPPSHLPRAVSHASTASRTISSSSQSVFTASSHQTTRIGSITWSAKPPPISLPPPVNTGFTGLAKADGRRPRRESFKPRQSIIPGFIGGRGASNVGRDSWGVVEEDEDVF
ncbi:microtubule associated protein-domain-containing protein [Naematelia encephala]|uniref:Microtubule associated protein-domain-containing protein n=1 Tax=Naematelia encephala TaxID=71784 RepID=A0A1Y2B5K8_9TREE|nr:microtubule associated protein-domain-containing protein [Naematelia encephala]